jgi:glycosyltransferase involved in cell wall biosynthesis
MGRLLVVANDFPFPPDHGAAVDMWNRLLILNQLGYGVDIVATVKNYPKPEHIEAVRPYVEDISIVERRRGIASVLTWEPFQVRSRESLRKIALDKKYEAVVLQTEYVASILENPSLRAEVRVLRVDNDEGRYFRALSKSAEGWTNRRFYQTEALKFDRFSPCVKSKCDLLWFASDWERKDHVRQHPEDFRKAVFLPPDPGVRDMRPYSRNGKEVLFIGSLTIPLNVEGLRWYLEKVHPGLSGIPGYSLTVAGRTGGDSLVELSRIIQQNSNISLCADPKELTALYERGAVFINPVIRGAGIKVKTIHALCAGLPVVSTSIGMEGTGFIPGTHLLVANTPEEFKQGIVTLLNDRSLAARLVHSAQSFLAETYNHPRIIEQSLSSILPNKAATASRLTKQNNAIVTAHHVDA